MLWENAGGMGGHASGAVIGAGVRIRTGDSIENAAVVRAELVRRAEERPPKALEGEFRGENFVVPLSR